jgi:site-specific recombinase XerD
MKRHQAVEQYIALKLSLGFRFHAESVILTAFSKAMGKVNLGQVKPGAVRSYLDGKGPVTRHWHRKWETLRPFYGFAMARGLARRSPLPTRVPKLDITFTAYIYTQEELKALLQAITPKRTGGLSPKTVRALLLLLYGAGLRISEALKLEIGDVDLRQNLLCVRQSKFFKTRWVPVGPKLAGVLRDYERQRPVSPISSRCFFLTNTGASVSRGAMEKIFAKLRLAAGVKRADGGRYQPRLHDLRHTAAVHRLVDWYRKGANVQSLLVNLSAYLGHVDIAATQKYLTWTVQLRQQANDRFARYVLGGSND